MAANGGRVNIQIGFTTDKAGLSQMQSLFQQITYEAKKPGQEMNTGLQKAAATAKTLDTILEKTFNSDLGTLNVSKFNQELTKSGLTLKSIKADFANAGTQGSMAYNRLAQSVLGTNLQLKESNKLLDSMATTMANTIKWGITSSIFNTITNSISKAVNYAKQLDTSLNDIRIVTDKSAVNMAQFAEEANNAAKAMGASTLDYTNASLIYYQQGLSDEEVKARAETTVKTANVTGQTGQAVSEQLTAVWNGYKVSAEETELYVDKLAAVAATTAADLEELSVGMSKVASAANAMGVDFDDLNAQIATIVSVTRQAPESVGTALKTIYARLGDLKVDGVDEFGVKLGEVSSQLQTMGIQILDTNGDMRDMTSVMTEVAEKWDTWTRAQQQAAAVAMAGKRQYNNLVALFENWDMYSEALETSADAMGTLQHQQDIYMESTEGKLKILKATWQDLYGDLIDKKELDSGIDALTNLVQVFDNFIESFGGGLKSIAAFGTIVANIFNKQISDGINGAIQRQEVFKNNLAIAQTANQIRMQGAEESGNTDLATAIAANTKEQIEYSQRIYDLRVGLNQEQANTLINYQREIGQLEEQIVLLEEQTKTLGLEVITHEEIDAILKADANELDNINVKYGQIEDEARDTLDTAKVSLDIVKQQLASEQELDNIKKRIVNEGKLLSADEEKKLAAILDEVKTTDDLVVKRQEILSIFNKNVSAQEKNLDSILKEEEAVDKVVESREKLYSLNQNKNNIKQEADAMLEAAKNAQTVTQTITSVTSSLGTMAMAWSSVNSLMETWNDESVSFGDKLTRTFMTLGMSIPMVLSSFKKLGEAFGKTTGLFETFAAVSTRNNALLKISTTNIGKLTVANQTNALSQEVLTTLRQKDNLTQEEEILMEKLSNASKKEQIMLLGSLDAKKLIDIGLTEEQAAALIQAKLAQDALNTSMWAFPGTWILAALAAIVAVTAIVIKNQEEALQREIDLNNAEIERINTLQEEVNANQKLCDEYDKLYKQYQNHEIEKAALYDVTDQLCEKYNLENGFLAKLTGNYEDLSKAIEKARKEELEYAIEESSKEVSRAKANIADVGDQNHTSITDTNLSIGLSGGWKGDEKAIKDIFIKNFPHAVELSNDLGFNASLQLIGESKEDFDVEDIVEYYEILQNSVDEIDKLVDEGIIGEGERKDSEYYNSAVDILGKITPAIEEYKTALEELANYKTQKIFLDEDVSSVSSIEEYFNKIESVRDKLNVEFNNDSEKVDKLINTYVQGLDNEFIQLGTGLTDLKNKLKLSDEEFQKIIDNWSLEDIQLLLSGNAKYEGLKLEEDLKAAVESAKNSLNEEDLTIAVSLRTKIASDKKLTKSQIKEMASEESTLEKDYEVELSDFDNQSQLGQVDTLNQIVNDKIALNNKYIKNARETAKEDARLTEIRLNDLQKEKDALQEKANLAQRGYNVSITNEEIDRLKELEQLIPKVEDEWEEYDKIAKQGLGVDKIGDLVYDNLINGIDGVITEAEVLKDLTDDIGESWTIAADKIERFGKNFPEIVADAENYKFLQDGSLQLTEQGKEALENTLNIRKQNIQASAEEYKLELQKQADIQAATAEYYEEQAALLQEYLTTDANAKETQGKLEKNLANYKQQLMELTGKNDAELNKVIQENLGTTTVNARMDTNAIYDYWCSVGEAAALAGRAYEEGFTPPGFNSSSGSGGASSGLKTFKAIDDKTAGFALERLGSDEIQDMINTSLEKAQKARNRESTLRSKMLGMGADVGGLSNSIDNAISGKGNGKNKNSSSKNKDKDEKDYDKEFDRYWQIKKAIDAVDKALKRLEKDKKNLYGTQLIDALKYENELLDKQKGYYEQLIQAQEQEAAELRGQLLNAGIMFDASGAIVNYAEATAKALAEYNNAIQQYNAGLIDETTFKVYEKSFENFKKLLTRYDTLYYTEIENTKDKIDELNRKKLENNLKSWEVKLQLKLDFKELKRDWNDFLEEISEDFQKVYQDLTLGINKLINNARTYIGSDGDIASIINAIHDVTHEIDVMQSGGKSNMFESITQAQEKLKELNEQIQDAAKGLHDLWKEAWQNYLDGIDQVANKFDDLMEQFEQINDELEFQGELIELLYGEEAYNLLNNLYKGQERSLENQVQSVKAQADMWHQLWIDSGATMENQADWNEDQKQYYEQWGAAQEKLNELIVDYIKLLKEDYLNAVQGILKELEGAITGSSLDRVKIQWERISAYSDKYLDDVEKAYEIQKFSNKINDQISKIDNLKQQQKLMALREKEIAYLREKEHLTQYDLDAAEARYQIALKEMALEDAQNNKTQMKLVRNDQGNWSYQYVADETETFAKQQELLEAYNNLYQLASDAYQENLESLQDLQERYLESAREIYESEVLSEEEKEQRLLELRQWYFEQYGLLAEENTLYRNDLTTSAAALLLEVYEQDQEAYSAMTETERELVDNLIQSNIEDYMDLEEKIKENLNNINDKSHEVMEETRADWTSSAQLLAELWNKDKGGSVRVEVVDAYTRIQKATEDYKNKVDWLAEATERNFGPEGIVGAIENASYATDVLNDKTVDLVENGVYYLSVLKEAVDEVADSWRSVQSEIGDAISLLERYISMLSSYNNAVDEHNARIEHAERADIGTGKTVETGGSGNNSRTGPRNSSDPSLEGLVSTSANYYIEGHDEKGYRIYHNDLTYAQAQELIQAYASVNRRGGDVRVKHYATGGYTGSWENGDTNGKLAFLHQKELVLNKDDTANFLAGINIIRDLSNLNGSISNAILGSVANMVAAIGSKKLSIPNGTTINETNETGGNVFNITAEFPNANDVNEIREAIMSLPNLASQYIARNVK